jgi:hypothetical protein
MADKHVHEMKDENFANTYISERALVMILDAASLYQKYHGHHASAVSVSGFIILNVILQIPAYNFF